MNAPESGPWPIGVACLILLVGAVINYRTLLVPNWLSLSALLGGWIVAGLMQNDVIPGAGGSVAASLAASLVTGAMLLPFYAWCGLGEGCVKLQAAFGAWLGCALNVENALFVTGMATIVGGLLTAIAVWMAIRRLPPASESLPDKPRLFPAQVTLSLGSLVGLIAIALLGVA